MSAPHLDGVAALVLEEEPGAGEPAEPGDPENPEEPVESGLSGSATKSGITWTATVTLTESVGESTSGSWNDGSLGGYVIEAGSTCSFSLTGIRNTTESVSCANEAPATVTIQKP